MRKSLIRTTALAATAIAATFSLTACGSGDKSDDASSDTKTTTVSDKKDISTESGGSDKNSADGIGTRSGGGVEQTCGANDLSWHVSSKTQAGGYYQLEVKASEGTTCWLPAELPWAAFKPSGGSEAPEIVAKPAEQSVGKAIKLSGDKAAYAGVNPKSVNQDGGKIAVELRHKVSESDKTAYRSGPIGKVEVLSPEVTNWHTDPQDAVPGIY
ncbi:DUF4232 domain-containing protein [Streptomyces sp. NPDC048172]|uniref:DUF4232 domain-containing protein n=1 Tax=Streptomyces sp. NPDC048172 TaxID=3365505 RepID=UPI00371ED5F2